MIKEEYEKAGDLGVVAVSARSNQRTMFPTKPLAVRGVFQVGGPTEQQPHVATGCSPMRTHGWEWLCVCARMQICACM
jgi:hypothetical protein